MCQKSKLFVLVLADRNPTLSHKLAIWRLQNSYGLVKRQEERLAPLLRVTHPTTPLPYA